MLEEVLQELNKRVVESGGTVYADLLAGTDREIKQPCAYEVLLPWALPHSKDWVQVRDHATFLSKNLPAFEAL